MLSLTISPPLLPFCESGRILNYGRSQKRTDLREEASALYCLREMTIVSLLTLKFLISSLK
ncbi:hypothetical protein YC2023_081673 [Brassica napus]